MITGQRASTGDTGSKSKDISDHYTEFLCHESSKMIPWLKGFLLVACVFAKAQATCEPKFSAGMPNKPSAAISSACLEATGTGSVSDADKKVIVEEHNRYRKNASPKPGNMQYMVWDDELASVAQGWTSTCPSGHDTGPERYIPGRGWSGQNMFSGTSGDYTWSDAIKYWHSEVKDFVYGDESSIGGRDTGHYTQIVWASSAKIGCGFAKCSGTDNFICNYMHAQGGPNLNKPYVKWDDLPADNCVKAATSTTTNHCVDGVCDCGGMVCYNGGRLDLCTCTCTCASSYTDVGANCGLTCASITSIQAGCGTDQFTEANCPRYTNLYYDCPHMCGTCRGNYADKSNLPPGTSGGKCGGGMSNCGGQTTSGGGWIGKSTDTATGSGAGSAEIVNLQTYVVLATIVLKLI